MPSRAAAGLQLRDVHRIGFRALRSRVYGIRVQGGQTGGGKAQRAPNAKGVKEVVNLGFRFPELPQANTISYINPKPKP